VTKTEYLHRLSLIPKHKHGSILCLRKDYINSNLKLTYGQKFSAYYVNVNWRTEATFIRAVVKNGDIFAHLIVPKKETRDEEGVIQDHVIINIKNTNLHAVNQD